MNFRVFLFPALAVLLLGGCGKTSNSPTFDEITVERINVVSPEGTNRVVISNKARFPGIVMDGKELDIERSVVPAGIVFYDEEGSERGGVAVMTVPGRGEQVGMIFDYQNSEAIGMGKFESANGESYSSSIQLADRIPLGSDIMEVGTSGPPRINIANMNGRAVIELNDADGKPRIRLFTEADGSSGIEMLDAEGKVLRALEPVEE
jgi:hypothetical protein